MGKVVGLRLWMPIFALTLLVLSGGMRADETNRPSVLVLHSYHKADWTDSLLWGMHSVLDQVKGIDIHVEYMDTKKINTPDYLQGLADIYTRKYKNITFDVIITSDDNALRFALKHHGELFKDAPIVFCGVNRFSPDLIKDHPNVTGVCEKGDFADTLALAFKLKPKAETVYVICDETKTGLINKENFLKALGDVNPQAKHEILDKLTLAQLEERLAILPPDDFAFFIAFWKDSSGASITPDMLAAPFKASTAPVFGRSEWMIGRGQTGGKCVSGFHQGEAAAKLAERILQGEDPTKIPVITDSPNKYMFDYEEFTHHRITVDMLPEGSIIANQPKPFYEVPKEVAVALAVSLVLLIALVIALVVNARLRHQAAVALQRSEEHYRGVFDSINDAIFIHDVETGKILDVNGRMLRMYGYDREEIPGISIQDLSEGTPPFNQQEAMAKVKAAALGTPQIFEWHAKKKNGDLLWVEVAARLAQVGGKERVLVLVRDTSERRAAQEELANSEERYRSLVDNIDLGITLVDSDYNIVMTNAAQGKFFGKDPKDFVGCKCYGEFEKRDSICEHCPGARAMDTGETVYQETKGVRDDGSAFPVALRAFPWRGGGGRIKGFIEVVEDISKQRHVEEERDRIFDLSLDMFCVCDFDGNFKQLNPSWSRTLGWTEAELMAESWKKLVHRDDRGRADAACDHIHSGESFSDLEVRLRCKDDTYRWLSWNALPDTDEKAIYAVVRDVTGNRAAAQALKESEERFRNIVQSSPMGMYMYELRGDDLILIEANPAADRYTGIQNADLIGKTIEEAFPNLAETEVPTQYRDIAANGTAWKTEDLIYEDDNIRGAYDVYAFQTSPNRMAVMFLDITDRKRAEFMLRLTQFAVDHIGDSAYWMGPDAMLTYVNDSACTELGYTRDELLQMSVHDIDPQFPEQVWAAHWEDVRQSKSFSLESYHRRKNGTMFPVEVTVNHVEFEGREFNCAFARNITDRKEAEEQILKFKTITDRSNYGAAISDLQGNLIYVNDAFAVMHGRKASSMIGSHIGICHSEAQRPVVDMLLQRIHHEGGFIGEEVWHVMADGTEFLTLMTTSLVCNDSGDPVYMAATVIDITDRKEIEEQLRQSQKMESIGQLAGGVAHDFNNMLGGIVGFAELLKEDLEDLGQGIEYVDQIIESAERASDLTSKLLAFSRKGKLHSKPVDLHAAIKAATAILERSIDRRIEIIMHLNATETIVDGDASQLQNSILNLCLNARDAMPEGGTLTIATKDTTTDVAGCCANAFGLPGKDYVEIRVIDSGVGMAPSTAERVFEPFFTTKGVGKGTGLGLAAVYGTVKEHGGAIDLESTPGAGTTFRLCLPVDETSVITAGGKEIESQIHGTGCVLLVDDEPVVRAMGEAMLRQLGYEVILADDGEDGLAAFRQHRERIDLVILDIVMPRMNGEDCFREIRKVDPEAKVLISSGFTHDTAVAKLEDEGVIGFVMKPYRRREMGEAILKAIKQ